MFSSTTWDLDYRPIANKKQFDCTKDSNEPRLRIVGEDGEGEVLLVAESLFHEYNGKKNVSSTLLRYNVQTRTRPVQLLSIHEPVRIINASLGPPLANSANRLPLIITVGQIDARGGSLSHDVKITTVPSDFTTVPTSLTTVSANLRGRAGKDSGRGYAYIVRQMCTPDTLTMLHVTALGVNEYRIGFKRGFTPKISLTREITAKKQIMWHSFDEALGVLSILTQRFKSLALTVHRLRDAGKDKPRAIVDGIHVANIPEAAERILALARNKDLARKHLPLVGGALQPASSLVAPVSISVSTISSNGLVLTVISAPADLRKKAAPSIRHFVIHQYKAVRLAVSSAASSVGSPVSQLMGSDSIHRTETEELQTTRARLIASTALGSAFPLWSGVVTVSPAFGAVLEDYHPSHSCSEGSLLAHRIEVPKGAAQTAIDMFAAGAGARDAASNTRLRSYLDDAEALDAVFPTSPCRCSTVLVRSEKAVFEVINLRKTSPAEIRITFPHVAAHPEPYNDIITFDAWTSRFSQIYVDVDAIVDSPASLKPEAFPSVLHLLASHLGDREASLRLVAKAASNVELFANSANTMIHEVGAILHRDAMMTKIWADQSPRDCLNMFFLALCGASPKGLMLPGVIAMSQREVPSDIAEVISDAVWAANSIKCNPLPIATKRDVRKLPTTLSPGPQVQAIDSSHPLSPRPIHESFGAGTAGEESRRAKVRTDLQALLERSVRMMPKTRTAWAKAIDLFIAEHMGQRADAVHAITAAVVRRKGSDHAYRATLFNILLLIDHAARAQALRSPLLNDAIALVALETLPFTEFVQFVQRDVFDVTNLNSALRPTAESNASLRTMSQDLAYYITTRAPQPTIFYKTINDITRDNRAHLNTLRAKLEVQFNVIPQCYDLARDQTTAYMRLMERWATLTPTDEPYGEDDTAHMVHYPYQLFMRHVTPYVTDGAASGKKVGDKEKEQQLMLQKSLRMYSDLVTGPGLGAVEPRRTDE
ncbi:hypothetical protein J8273_5053 [Carpediemonas membranifera]|uniref:Uncharacterized protein n=1 Tax=Carpediemonas membranifera TaxID=201153 RepID=A0A8J6E1W4_9EUKA|nr:hypothetical protein J8273_5053 [Carpediemonas membranifera]|eukprot:KAG9393566.1 hypothetical protein J8273_5053 [Carpediemonas membranifera]